MKRVYIKPSLEVLKDNIMMPLLVISNTSTDTTGKNDPNKDYQGPGFDSGGGTGGMSRQGFFDDDYDF